MPLYDYSCMSCGAEFSRILRIAERHTGECDCGGLGKLLIPKRAPGLSTFQPGWWRDIGPEPMYIGSPQELRNALDKHNGRAPLLEDGIWKTSPGPDPVGVRGADPEASGYHGE